VELLQFVLHGDNSTAFSWMSVQWVPLKKSGKRLLDQIVIGHTVRDLLQ
jgi:hypothetical protein